MTNEDKAQEMFDKAVVLEFSDPEKGILIFREAIEKYPKTLATHNYLIPSLFSTCISSKNWDIAIDTCKLASKLYPDEKRYWDLDKEACELKKTGKEYEALETWLERYTIDGRHASTLQRMANQFVEIGAHDRAWRLYNEAVGLAIKEGYSPHLIRESMADLLLKENKPNSAVEILIFGIDEAEKYNRNGTPKSTISKLKKALKLSGCSDPKFADTLFEICKKRGKDKALILYHDEIEKK